ncbi:DNA polymerase [Escherichia coli]|nr:DNA polymerase [Escherichia coli]
MHTSYHQAVTATGRLSSTDPNLQNIPVRTQLAVVVSARRLLRQRIM